MENRGVNPDFGKKSAHTDYAEKADYRGLYKNAIKMISRGDAETRRNFNK
jgi:hypothetical protein